MKQMKKKMIPVIAFFAMLLMATGTFAACTEHDWDEIRTEYKRVSDEMHQCKAYLRCTICGATTTQLENEEHNLLTEEDYYATEEDDEDGEIDDGVEEDFDDSEDFDDEEGPEEFVYHSISATQHASTEKFICEACGAKVTITEVEDHEFDDEYDKITYVSASAKEHTIKKYYYCSGCNKEKIVKKNQAHKFGSWKTTKAATALKTGTKERTCSKCGKKETKSIPKLKATIKLSAIKKTIKVSGSYVLKISNLANGDAVKSITTSKKNIVQLKKVKTNQYKITAKKKGTTAIKVLLKSGKKATCNITVVKK